MFEKRVRAVKGIDFQFKTAQDEKYFIDGEVDVVNFKNEAEFATFVSLGFFEDAEGADIGPPELQVVYPAELQLSGNLEQLAEAVDIPEDAVLRFQQQHGLDLEKEVQALVVDYLTEESLPEDVKEHIRESDEAIEELHEKLREEQIKEVQQILDGPEQPIYVDGKGELKLGINAGLGWQKQFNKS